MINRFRGKYYFLSNSFPHTFWYKGIKYKNAEAAFQAQKDLLRTKEFTSLSSKEAKYLGKSVNLRKDWDEVKISIMRDILQSKFSDEKLKNKLIDTNDHRIISNKNNLGKILEDLRTQYLH